MYHVASQLGIFRFAYIGYARVNRRTFTAIWLWLLAALHPLSAQPTDSLMSEAARLYAQNSYALAQERYLQALQLAEQEHDPATMARASLALVRCHYFLYDHAAAFKWGYHALHTIQQHRIDSLLSNAYYLLGVLYIEAEKVDSAEKYAFKAMELMRSQNDNARLSQTYSTLAELHLNTSKDRSRIEYMMTNAEKHAELSYDKGMMAFAASKRYNYNFFLKKDYAEALRHINRAESLYLETGNREAILNAFRGKAECLAMLGDTTARTYMLKWFEFKDSVLQAEKAVNVAKFETLYETRRKEQENMALQQENGRNRLLLIMAAIIFLLLTVVGLWLYSRNNLRKKQQELQMLQNLQRDKERIARDLHDNVGGQLSYIIYSLDGINDEDSERRSEVTESINQSVRSVIGSLRETIWAISDANISVQDLSDKLKVFARSIFKHTDVKVDFSETMTSERELNALLGLNLYRICQEILNNSFKHAEASEVKMDLRCENGMLTITLSDDGIGFDVSDGKKEHYGLQNIRKRASEFGISLRLQTEAGKGTSYTLMV